MSATTVLVVGATGNQGNAVIDQLLESDEDYELLALTRDATTDHAQATGGKGEAVELVEGDLDEPETVRPYAERADSVFACINFWTLGYDRQVRYGENLAELLGDVDGIEHVVYSGVADQDRDTGIPHFDSAQVITEALRDADLPLTVLKPAFFMENWEVLLEDIADGTVAHPFEKGQQHNQTNYYDTARAARVAFENPEEFVGVEESVVSDVNTLSEIAETISDVTGWDVDPYHVPLDVAYDEFGEEYGVMAEWWQNNDSDYSFYGTPADTEETFGFEPLSFEEYLRRNDWEGGKESPAHIAGWAKAGE